jgi:hypothetical protein
VDPRAWGVKPNSDSSNAIFNKALGNLYPSSLGARVNPSSENLIMAGVGLHVLADSYSHEGYGIAKDPAGHIPNDWLGGPETDNPTIPKHKDKALEMAKRVNERLQDLAQTLGMSWERFYKGTDLEKDIAPFFAQASETRYNPYMAPGSPGSTYQVKVPKTKAVRIVEWQALIKQLGPDEYWDYNVVRQRFDTGGRYSGAFNSVVDELIPRDMR